MVFRTKEVIGPLFHAELTRHGVKCQAIRKQENQEAENNGLWRLVNLGLNLESATAQP